MEPIVFLAYLPDIEGAVRLSGGSNGARAHLQIPETHVDAAWQLRAMANLRDAEGRKLPLVVVVRPATPEEMANA